MANKKGIINLFYKFIFLEAYNGIMVLTDRDDISKFKKLSKSNLCIEEKIEIDCFKMVKSLQNLTIEEYINNGWYSCIGGDRYIFTNIEDDNIKYIFSGFDYISSIDDTDHINIYIIDKNIDINNNNSLYIYIAFAIIKHTFCKRLLNNKNNIISNYLNNITTVNNMIDYIINNTCLIPYYNYKSRLLYIDFIISAIMILDKILDLKFNDFETVYNGIKEHLNNFVTKELLQKIYDYAIDENPSDSDYLEINRYLINNY